LQRYSGILYPFSCYKIKHCKNKYRVILIVSFTHLRCLSPKVKERYRKIPPSKYGTYATGLAVWFLIIHDHKKYFEKAYKQIYGPFDSHDYRLFEEFGVNISELPGDIFDCD
jgi:hypothetical protein